LSPPTWMFSVASGWRHCFMKNTVLTTFEAHCSASISGGTGCAATITPGGVILLTWVLACRPRMSVAPDAVAGGSPSFNRRVASTAVQSASRLMAYPYVRDRNVRELLSPLLSPESPAHAVAAQQSEIPTRRKPLAFIQLPWGVRSVGLPLFRVGAGR